MDMHKDMLKDVVNALSQTEEGDYNYFHKKRTAAFLRQSFCVYPEKTYLESLSSS